ncbi:MAG: hypothetical protein IJR25_01725 [Bacteroidales bacterium]|nr:hypothetical protein [Bacteroidales bacterium]
MKTLGKIALMIILMGAFSCTKVVKEYYEIPVEVPVESEDGDKLFAYSIQAFEVLPTNSAAENKVRLQNAIDWATDRGAVLWVEPVEGGYPIQGGIVLKKNVSLVGVHGPTGRGTVKVTTDEAGNVIDRKPTGSLFVITDKNHPFITVQSATQIKGIQFYYPEQGFNDAGKIVEYPPTIQVSQDQAVHGVTLQNLTFYGCYFAMDFRAKEKSPCEQILFEHCYGYPIGGRFIAINYCYDIPRILHCHVNPAIMREFRGDYNHVINDYVVNQKTYAYWIDHTDNAQVMDIFTFGTYGGIYLGPYTYGQLTNFNFDQVCNGVLKDGNTYFNRIWEVAQGSIIASVSPDGKVANIHPFIVQGQGQISITNVDCFSGRAHADVLTTQGVSYDFLKVQGSNWVLVTGVNCRMRNYQSDVPITVANTQAQVSFINCSNKDGYLFDFRRSGDNPNDKGTYKVYD